MDREKRLLRANIGCGQTPTIGWRNFDNSFSIRLMKFPLVVKILEMLHLLGKSQKEFISFAKHNDIIWANATNHIPLPDNSVEVLYTSHMLEHLDIEEAKLFLRESYRVLAPNGIIRIAVPDLRKLINRYITDGDSDKFIENTYLALPRSKNLVDRLKNLLIGARHHHWMYDGPSLCRLLSAHGFKKPTIVQAGSTSIPNPEELNLCERADDSVYAEAYK